MYDITSIGEILIDLTQTGTFLPVPLAKRVKIRYNE